MMAFIIELLKYSPVLAVACAMWYIQRKDYKDLVTKVQEDSQSRENRLYKIINDLTKKFDLIENVDKEVREIKKDIKKLFIK